MSSEILLYNRFFDKYFAHLNKRRKIRRMANKITLGVFDSGVGGLTVLKEIMKRDHYERIIYSE